jgi:adenylate cyclase
MALWEVDPAIVGLLQSLGATDAQIEEAAVMRRLPALAVDVVLTRDFSLSVAEVGARLGSPTEEVVEIYRLFGLSLNCSGPALGDGDLALLAALSLAGAGHVGAGSGENFSKGAGDNLLRVIGMSIARIADAAVSTFVQDVEETFETTDVDLIDWVRADAQIGEVAHQIAPCLGTLFVHHLLEAIQRQRRSQEGVSERALARLAVGFVDLVGFTPLSRHLATRDLVGLVTRFEARAFDIVSACGGRVVKHIGDEVMYSAPSADAAAHIALALVGEFTEEVEPRGGFCHGEVLTLRGDYYGPVVNLAARLADQAVPGEVLIDTATAALLTDVTYEPSGRRLLKGFDEPIAVSSLST